MSIIQLSTMIIDGNKTWRALSLLPCVCGFPPQTPSAIANLSARVIPDGLRDFQALTYRRSSYSSAAAAPHHQDQPRVKSPVQRISNHVAALVGRNQHYALGIWSAAAVAYPILGLLTEGFMISAASTVKTCVRRVATLFGAILLRIGAILLIILGGAFVLLWSALQLLHQLLMREAGSESLLLEFDRSAAGRERGDTDFSRTDSLQTPMKETPPE